MSGASTHAALIVRWQLGARTRTVPGDMRPLSTCQSAAKFDPVSASNVDPLEGYSGKHPIRRSWSGLHSLIGCG